MGPDFIIIGGMKCGTSTLHEQLARQPGVFMTTPKEPNFFSDDDQYQRGRTWYASLFEKARPGDIKGESSTHYTKLPTYPSTVGRIAEILPEVKLVYVIRHPIDRLVSQYVHEWSQGIISVPITTALRRHSELIAYSEYARQLEPYIETFGRDRILVACFERMTVHLSDVLQDIADFIGYSDAVQVVADMDRQNVSRDRMRKSPWRDAVVHAPGITQLRQHVVPKSVRNWVKGFWQMRRRPSLPATVHRDLESRFDEQLSTLGQWFGISMTCANYREIAAQTPLKWTAVTQGNHA